MPLPIVILLAGTGFFLTALLGLIRTLLPLRHRPNPPPALDRIARIPHAESLLEEMTTADPKSLFPKLALDMLRARRPQP